MMNLHSSHFSGHDLMSMFPAQSPMTVQMNTDPRCRFFEQQERAFFALPNHSREELIATPPELLHREDYARALKSDSVLATTVSGESAIRCRL